MVTYLSFTYGLPPVADGNNDEPLAWGRAILNGIFYQYYGMSLLKSRIKHHCLLDRDLSTSNFCKEEL